MNDFEILTEDEVNALGLSSVVHGGQIDPDNPIVSLEAVGSAQQDRDGRQIISYKQFKDLSAADVRMDNYAVRMRWPGRSTTHPIQASKFQKWYGLGYRPVGDVQEAAKKRLTQLAEGIKESPVGNRVFYYCETKYPGCERAFDKEKGLKAHWGKDHGEWKMTKKEK